MEKKIINLGGVNCYLITNSGQFILIDTGISAKRAVLEEEMINAGCRPGNLKLVILTHGDSDHVENAAYLQNKYGAKIAIHQYDSGMVERGDMTWNRKAKPDKLSAIFRFMILVFSIFMKPNKFDKFKPDVLIENEYVLSDYGFDVKVLNIPGHSKGSIGILTNEGDLFCGDLIYNIPGFLFIDDLADFNASIGKLKKLGINMVYPGHGKPFTWKRYLSKRQK